MIGVGLRAGGDSATNPEHNLSRNDSISSALAGKAPRADARLNSIDKHCMASLILAQDKRWRRA
jgi:hypothetical protein